MLKRIWGPLCRTPAQPQALVWECLYEGARESAFLNAELHRGRQTLPHPRGSSSPMAAASHIHIVNVPFPSLYAKLACKNRNQSAGLTDEEPSYFIIYGAINYMRPQFPVGCRLPSRLDFFFFFLETELSICLSVPVSQTLLPVETLLIKPNSQDKLKLSIQDWNEP